MLPKEGNQQFKNIKKKVFEAISVSAVEQKIGLVSYFYNTLNNNNKRKTHTILID